MGVSMAGFQSQAVVEWDRWACDTIRQNQQRGHPLVAGWPLFEGDVRNWARDLAASCLAQPRDLVAGGPPCQPFSMGGKHQAFNDERDMFPTTVDVIRRLKPRAFIVENVKGLTRSAFHNYFQYIQLQLEFPDLQRRVDDSWVDHHAKLQAFKTAKRRSTTGLSYRLAVTLVNAANYGVAQKRERVFIVGFRSDQDVRWSFPAETHSLDALLHDQWVSGEYWDRHSVPKSRRPNLSEAQAKVVAKLKGLGLPKTRHAWLSVRDALRGLPEPDERERGIHNHRLQLGARSYPGHTGSPLDLPAKTLKAGDHGVPGGENMLSRPDGTVRYFSVREAARLQTFPDDFVFRGSWSESMRQLGNAVPVRLGETVAASVASTLRQVETKDQRKAA